MTTDPTALSVGQFNDAPPLAPTPDAPTNTITPESLTQAKPIVVPPPVPDTTHADIASLVGGISKNLNETITKDSTAYGAGSDAYIAAVKEAGNQGANNEAILKANGVDTLKRSADALSSQIESEQKTRQDKIDAITANGAITKEQAQPQIDAINRESASKIAALGIGLSGVSRQYDTASTIANRLITANTDRLKSEIESRKFILDQLGTKLATEKSNSFQIQLKQIDLEDQMLKDAIKTGTDGLKDGSIDSTVGTKALQDLVSGKISLSTYYSKIGNTDSTTTLGSNINGYDITSYATDPLHEQKVLSIYNSIGNISDVATADAQIKALVPNSPITGQMLMDAAQKYGVDPKLMLSLMMQDSSLGTAGLGVKTKNAGNVGNTDSGATQTFKTWGEGVDAVAQWLKAHPAKPKDASTEYNTIGLLANTNYNPNSNADKNAKNYLDAYLKSSNGSLPTATALFGSARGSNQTKFTNAQNRAKELYAAATGQELPDLASLTANKKILAGNNALINNLSNQEGTVAANFKLAIDNLDKSGLNQSSVPINNFLDTVKNMLGDPNVAQYIAQNITVQNELGSLLAVKNASGTTVHDKLESSGLLPKGASEDQQKTILKTLLQEANNSIGAIKSTNSDLYNKTDPLQINPDNPNRKVQPKTENDAQTILTKYSTAHSDKQAEMKTQMDTAEKVIGRPLTAMEFLQAHPEYNQNQ